MNVYLHFLLLAYGRRGNGGQAPVSRVCDWWPSTLPLICMVFFADMRRLRRRRHHQKRKWQNLIKTNNCKMSVYVMSLSHRNLLSHSAPPRGRSILQTVVQQPFACLYLCLLISLPSAILFGNFIRFFLSEGKYFVKGEVRS